MPQVVRPAACNLWHMKVFIASLGTETNTFVPFPTGLATFEQTCLIRGGAYGEKPFAFAVLLVLWRRLAEARGWEVAESLYAFAQPSGITLRHVYEEFRDEILADLRAAMPVGAVLLSLHGAMIADSYDDCEGDLLATVRAIVGPDVPVGAELDLHCHLTHRMIEQATALVAFKEYPHTDYAERAEELFAIIADAATGKTQPHMALYDCGMIGIYHTTREPMRSYVDRLQRLEGHDGVLSVSVAHGFPWGDMPEMGTRTLVITDNRPEHGAALAEQLGRELFALRDQLQPPYLTIDQALAASLAAERGPVVLADCADNPGGGASGDSTFILRAMLERGIENAALACIWDPVAVATAIEAGVGARFDMRLGGKMGPMSGDPLDLTVTVRQIARNAAQYFGPADDPGLVPLGDVVALHANGIDIVANTLRTQIYSPDVFTCVGIDPRERRVLVVKSMQHFYAAFAPIAAHTIYVAAPGTVAPDFRLLPYRRANRNIWPINL